LGHVIIVWIRNSRVWYGVVVIVEIIGHIVPIPFSGIANIYTVSV